MQKESEIVIQVQCDYCGAIVEKTIAKYNRGHKNGCNKDACNKCKSKKIQDVMSTKYGVNNAMKVEDFKSHMQHTVRQKYGVDNVAHLDSIKQKRKNTNIERYGVENPMQNESIQEKHHIHQFYKNNSYVVSSKPQEELCSILHGILNYPIGKYFADILLSDNIVVEYDGSGHDMSVRMGRITYEDFIDKENKRIEYFINNGFKIIKLITRKDIVYSKDIMERIINECKELLIYNNVIYYNLDSQLILETTE